MKRGTKCVVQTINLSNPKTCIRPKVQRPTSTNVDYSCDPNRASPSARSAAVKAYSWKDAQWRHPSKFCEPFPKKSPPSPILCRAAAFFIKSAIVAGLICWTCSEGLWGSSTETEELYYRMTSVIFPDRQTSLPRFEEVKYSVFEVYNDMLVKGMDIMVSVPRDVYQRLQEFLFPCSATRKRERRAKRSDEY
ncbi:PREDICTED: uncharacterized protein LOC108775238 [Cyphomyrmex costatus]|uniref:uncharacterized protein LOC108775238 n=1 Tax=Cyphomyrmex costatus TaxID=456900 RepID=UPI0008523AEE|nr:PREDICTED: uncharacterized protein LOC108775238 [Cyphomyrmex costatus]XP_018397047.1 PREDICTED: uncharacterized protein LOC108775238 [Cyphomyrmex costatus]